VLAGAFKTSHSILQLDVIKFEPDLSSNMELKVYLSKKIGTEVLRLHHAQRSVVEES